jgi:hypothetical protein
MEMVQTTAEETTKKQKVERLNWAENGKNDVRELKVKGFVKKAKNRE